jgi:hypothetical protein
MACYLCAQTAAALRSPEEAACSSAKASPCEYTAVASSDTGRFDNLLRRATLSGMTRDEIPGIVQQVERFRSRDLTHAEVGTAYGFHEAAGSKDSLADYFSSLLKLTLEVGEALDPTLVSVSLNNLSTRVSELEAIANTIDQFVVKGVNTPNYPTQRSGYIDEFKSRGHTAREQLQPFELFLRVASLERSVQAAHLNVIRDDATNLLAELRAATSESTKILANVRDRVLTKGLQDATGTFAALSSEHADHERRWFRGLLLGAAGIIAAVVVILIAPMSVANAPAVVAEVFKRLLAVSALAVFMRVALAKYNAERNLRIIYAHRETVIAQFRVFESAIGESNPDAKNQLRLEIAKYIFTDPITGYLSADSAEININPVISTIEKVASRGGT